MKILILTKRYYTGRDLLGDRYGRMWELPYFLAKSGHQVLGIALSYRATKEVRMEREGGMNLDWRSINIGFPPGIGLIRYWRELKACIAVFKPDLIWAGSDVFHVILGARLGSMLGIQVVADLYDNYESFSATRLVPGAAWLFRRSLAGVQGISCVSGILAHKIACDLLAGLESLWWRTESIQSPSDRWRRQSVGSVWGYPRKPGWWVSQAPYLPAGV